MTMNITAKDVGRKVVANDGRTWEILHFLVGSYFCVTARCNDDVRLFRDNGNGMYTTDLIRFADEPEAKPPNHISVGWKPDGEPVVGPIVGQHNRPDLAGQTFTYRRVE